MQGAPQLCVQQYITDGGAVQEEISKNFPRTFEEFRGEWRKTEKNGKKALPFRIAMDWHDLSGSAVIFQGDFTESPKVSALWAFPGSGSGPESVYCRINTRKMRIFTP